MGALFKVFYIQNKEMSHSWFYHFDTRMSKICLFLISFLNGVEWWTTFAPVQKILDNVHDLKLMRLFRNGPDRKSVV